MQKSQWKYKKIANYDHMTLTLAKNYENLVSSNEIEQQLRHIGNDGFTVV